MYTRKMEFLSLVVLVVAASSCRTDRQNVYLANGIKIGEVTPNSVIIWSRATGVKEPNMQGAKFERNKNPKNISPNFNPLPAGSSLEQMEGAVPGTTGRIRLILRDTKGNKTATEWKNADEQKNFTCGFKISGLESGTRYEVTAQVSPSMFGKVTDEVEGGFCSAPGPNEVVPILCTSLSCQSWWDRDDRRRGFKVYDSMLRLEPDFFVHTGDFVYYDRTGPLAANISLARHKWNRMCGLNSIMDFYNNVPSYFIKDDHDTLKNDCYPQVSPLGKLSFKEGVKIWYEQTPIESKPYRTFRWGKDLQIWIVEVREYRSNNDMPDGPKKTILGNEQKEWLTKTVTSSDATFKLLFSPTPIVGPDREKKADNHANKAFKTEGDWLREFLAGQKNMYVINGDRHWQYVSVDPVTGLREYSQGPASDRHAAGWQPADKRPEHRFLRVKGGFVAAEIDREKGIPTITFTHYDVDGKAVYIDKLTANRRDF